MRGSETISFVAKPRVDRLKDSDAEDPEPRIVKGVLAWPRARYEENQGWVQIEGENVFLPGRSGITAAVTADDTVTFRGEEYSIDSPPATYVRHAMKGMLITIKRVS